jgi:nicotinic acid mononucleotide adenylyltransferase
MDNILNKNLRKQNTKKINLIIECTKKDLDKCIINAPNEMVIKLIRAIKKDIIEILEELREKTMHGIIIPNIPLRLTISESTIVLPELGIKENWRIGFLGTTGDPFHWGHILAVLKTAVEFNLHTIIIQIMGDHPHKRERKQLKEHRHTIAKLALEYFHPLIRYTPLGFNNMKVGEENASEFLLMNYDNPIDLYYISGSDVSPGSEIILESCRKILSCLEYEKKKVPNLYGAFHIRENIPFNKNVKKIPWIFFQQRKFRRLPKVNGKEISGKLFRENPTFPILPFKAYEYIKKHNLYTQNNELSNK